MYKKDRISIRLDGRTWMLLFELSALTGASVSALVRHMLARSLEAMLDEDGNWLLGDGEEAGRHPRA